MQRIYLDHNATSPLRSAARAAFMEHLDPRYGNAGSVHAFGHRARMAIETSRARVAGLIRAAPEEVIFTAGGTEGNNLAVYGLARMAAPGARRIVTSAIEHPSIASILDDLATRGFEVVRIRPDASGVVDAGKFLEAASAASTACATLMMANNETGALQPIAEIGRELRSRGVPFHCDAVQATGRVPIDVGRLSIDLLTLTAHKMGGPHGVGALFVRRGTRLEPHLRGGGQELNRRPGTENTAAIAGLGALAETIDIDMEGDARRISRLRDELERAVSAGPLQASINGAAAPRVPNTSSLAFDGLSGEALVIALDLEGIAVSTGAACSAGTIRSSPTLEAMGLQAAAASSIRVSLGHETTRGDIEHCLRALERVVARLRVGVVASEVRIGS